MLNKSKHSKVTRIVTAGISLIMCGAIIIGLGGSEKMPSAVAEGSHTTPWTLTSNNPLLNKGEKYYVMQTTLLFLGLLTFPGNMLLGLGVMLASNEVPRISQQFGLDSSVRVNMMSVVHATTTAVNLTRSVARATGK